MTEAERMQFEQVRRDAEQARGEVGSLRAHVFGPRGGAGGGVEFVAFTNFTGFDGNETTLAAFLYTFTDSDGTVRTGVAPTQARPYGKLFAGTHGLWDKSQLILVVLDERPVTAVCNTAPALITTGPETTAFGF